MPFVHGFGGPELAIILLIVVIIFGVGRLPEVGGAMGKAIREFRSSVSGKSETDENAELEAGQEKREEHAESSRTSNP